MSAVAFLKIYCTLWITAVAVVKLSNWNGMVASSFMHLTQYFSNKSYSTRFVEKIDNFKTAKLQWLSSNKHILQIFSNQRTACSNGWQQKYLWNKDSVLNIWIT